MQRDAPSFIVGDHSIAERAVGLALHDSAFREARRNSLHGHQGQTRQQVRQRGVAVVVHGRLNLDGSLRLIRACKSW